MSSILRGRGSGARVRSSVLALWVITSEWHLRMYAYMQAEGSLRRQRSTCSQSVELCDVMCAVSTFMSAIEQQLRFQQSLRGYCYINPLNRSCRQRDQLDRSRGDNGISKIDSNVVV